ncbi:M23 family metallopeptidase [Reyranella sp.]|uniref:M23 family metallopeptidase n=1 Tax=Reyranella sp. TaxID=1929291 RepID=UPI003BAD040D
MTVVWARRFALAAFCVVSVAAIDVSAHVRTPDYGQLGRPIDTVLPAPESAGPLERRAEAKTTPAVSGTGCTFSRGSEGTLGDGLSTAGLFGPPPIAELDLASAQAAGLTSQEMIVALAAVATSFPVIRVAHGTTRDGVPCPLYVSVETEDGPPRMLWRYTPDDEPEGWFDEDGRRLGGPALAAPRPGSRLSSPFGPRRYYGRASGSGFHNGIDYESRIGQPILAAADGVVELRGPHFEYGLTVKIRHAAHFTTLYAHMARFATNLAVGTRVRKGEIIGYVGMTGRSTGAHLHFSTIVNGKFTDPAPYLSDRGPRALKPRALVGFRQWQDDVRAAAQEIRGRERRPPVQDDGWTSRM